MGPLLFMATACCYMDYFASFIIKFIIQRFLLESKEYEAVRSELISLKKQMNSISMVDEFAKYAKLQRKFNKLQDVAKEQINARSAKKIKWNLILSWAVSIISWSCTTALLYFYRREPVITYPKGLLWPLEPILSWPTEVDHCISLPIWMGLLKGSYYKFYNFIPLLKLCYTLIKMKISSSKQKTS